MKLEIMASDKDISDESDKTADQAEPSQHAPLRTIWPPFKIEEHPIDDIRPLRVVVVGGGISGIIASVFLPIKVPKIDLVVYERDSDLGGVWHTNVYPGVRCDVPAHAYQATFASSAEWTEAYATGAEIKRYWDDIATRYRAKKYIRFNHRVLRAEWLESKAKWQVEVESSKGKVVNEADFVITATGHFSDPRLPSSHWDPDFDPTGKRVAVIGNGASGLQVLPPIQKADAHVDHYARNPTYVAAPIGGEELAESVADHIEEVKKSPELYLKFRKELESKLFSRFGGIFKEGDANRAAKQTIHKLMSKRLGEREDLMKAIIPAFHPNCRRLTPGPGYLEAFTADNVDYITTPIDRFTKTGIVDKNGVHREVDAVICSTGHDVSFSTAFSVISNGRDLQSAWRPGGNPGFPDTYLGLAAAGYPNFFMTLGPNSTGLAGTLCHSVENQITYFAKVLRKISTQGIRTIVPTEEAMRDFRAYCESYFPRTVMSEDCSSWYNGGIKGGRIHGLWPGSAAHVDIVRREPRWEDFSYTHWNEQGNRSAYFGNGWSRRDVAAASGPDGAGVDLTPWLRAEALAGKVDLRTYHEGWWDHAGVAEAAKDNDGESNVGSGVEAIRARL
ncbi:FAD-binding monooxygenase moxY [Pseudocercospora fuligena]|uniref:FAD-binding monooxygenase moxY n=1 Tax=Pseudocercospora fuligena TaxID=685502 RepID=A0A8H6RCH0_9PEZI|nr:FAD-binding monooxygenase moxY [Pseudocercospora fuligena]